MNFKGKVVLISGATGGMGEEIAKKLGNIGCKLALFARREEKLKTIADQIKNKDSEIVYKVCDVKKINDIKNAVKFTLKKYGRIDIAILAAGILVPNPIQTFDSKIIKDSVDINFMGNVYFIEQILPIMKKQKNGTIVAVSTLPDKRGVPGWGAYGSSKAALSWLMDSLRAEAKERYNIDFVTVKPGSVLTPMIQEYGRHGAITAEKAAEKIINGILKGKKTIQFPLGQVLLVRTMDNLPLDVYDSMDIETQKGEGYPIVGEK